MLYLHGLSTSDFTPALEQFLGTGAGLSPPVITRLTTQWQTEAKAFDERSLQDSDYVYVWADGIHLKVRLTQDKVCLLVGGTSLHEVLGGIGVRPDGRKELIALTDGHRESTESWADLLRSCKRRGMAAPVLAAGDGALGFWAALRDVFPETKEQRCWFHKSANVLNCLPKSAQPGARAALAEIWQAEDKDHALKAVKAFEVAYGAKWPKATAKITDDVDVLLAFYDYPAEHWVHLRTTNPSRPSRPSDSGNASPKGPDPGPLGSRWPSSSSSQHRAVGAQSTHPTSSHSSEPEPPSPKANSSNETPRTTTWTKPPKRTPSTSLGYYSFR